MMRLRCPVADERVQLGEDGVVVIPAAYRAAMGLKGGEMLHLRLDEEGLHIQSQLTGQGTVRRRI
jgi:AbrB family looped-hinge helix DNA binding protein